MWRINESRIEFYLEITQVFLCLWTTIDLKINDYNFYIRLYFYIRISFLSLYYFTVRFFFSSVDDTVDLVIICFCSKYNNPGWKTNLRHAKKSLGKISSTSR